MCEKKIFRVIFYIILITFICFSKKAHSKDQNISQIKIIINDKKCEPMEIITFNEKIQFVIKNESKRKIEWEILKGVIVIDERENIIPGFTQKITIKLDAGKYNMTCGLLSNPQGIILVKEKKINNQVKHFNWKNFSSLVRPIFQYKKYVTKEIEQLLINTKIFITAIKNNDLKKAKFLFAKTRQHYERVESIAELFSDLDARIDAQEDSYEEKSLDPKFIGFHKLEKALFFEKTTLNMERYANYLYNDILDLKKRINDMIFPANKVIGGAALLMEEIAANKISGEEDRYSKTDLWDISANIDGAKKIIDLFRPIISKIDLNFLSKLDKNFYKIEIVLNKYKTKYGYKSYDNLNLLDKIYLKGHVYSLAEDLSLLRSKLNID